MSLTSYRAAPPRVEDLGLALPSAGSLGAGFADFFSSGALGRGSTRSGRGAAPELSRRRADRLAGGEEWGVKRKRLDAPKSVFCRPGGGLLSHVLRQSTIGAKAFDGRVRDGIGSDRLARATRPAKDGKQNRVFGWVRCVRATVRRTARAKPA